MALAIKMVDLSWIIPLGKSQVSHDTYELDPCPVTQSGTIGHTVAKSCKKSSKLFHPGTLADSLFFGFHYINIFCKMPIFSKYNIRPPLVIFSAFLKKQDLNVSPVLA